MVYGYLANSLMLQNDQKMLTPTSFYWNSVLKLSWTNVIGVTSLPRSFLFYFIFCMSPIHTTVSKMIKDFKMLKKLQQLGVRERPLTSYC